MATFGLVALIFTVKATMVVQRLGYIKRNPATRDSFATGEAAARYCEPVAMPSDNFRNLFEMPALYFALVPLLLVFHHAGHVEVALALVYVALRALHSFIHIGPKRVTPRFIVYLLSCAALSAMWIGFAVELAMGR